MIELAVLLLAAAVIGLSVICGLLTIACGKMHEKNRELVGKLQAVLVANDNLAMNILNRDDREEALRN